MKKHLLTPFLFVVCSIYTNAQTITIPLEYGTNLDQDVTIETRDIERIRFKNTGLIGIGTKTPTEALDIFGNLKVSGKGIFGGSISTGGSIKTDSLQTKTAGANLIHLSPSLFMQNVYILGNTGLGNTSPSEKLDVTGNAKISGNFFVGGNTNLIGTLNATGATILNSLQVNQNANFASNLTVLQNTILNTLTTNGIANFSNNVNFLQNISVGGNTQLTGTLNTTGLTTLNGLQVNQDANFASNLAVAQNTTLNNISVAGTATFANGASFQNSINVTGNVVASDSLIANSLKVKQGLQSKNLTVNNIVTDSIHATNKMEIGNSMVLLGGSTVAGTSDQIYTDDANPLLIQSNALYNYPTVINANNTANVGIGITPTTGNKLEVNGSIFASGDESKRWTSDEGYKVAYIVPNGSAFRTDARGQHVNKYLGFVMKDGMNEAGWWWVASCTADNSAPVIIPMALNLDQSGAPNLLVRQANWCDYVFANDYKRPGFEEQLQFYKTNKHLRGVASEKEIAEKGLSINETLKGLTLNVEEAKLDMIDLYKLIEQQKKALEEQQKQIEKLKEEISSSIKK